MKNTNGVGMISLASGKHNAMTMEFVDALNDGIEKLEQDADCKAVIVTSAHEKFFCPGFDLFATYEYPRQRMRSFLKKFSKLYQRMFSFPKPLLAAMNGHAVAGGFCLTLACDYRLMADTNAMVGNRRPG